MKEVTIVQRTLPHYRVDFFEGLYKSLEKENIKLNLIYGTSNPKESLKKDEADLDWATKIKNYHLKIGSIEFCWQPCLKLIRNSDLVIVEQANKNLINYWLLFINKFRQQKVAFWGHGRNLQDKKKSIANIFKNSYINACDWWFAYTSKVKEYLANNNFPEERITVVQNAINTSEIIKLSNEVSREEIIAAKRKFDIESENIGIYCGGIYSEKRIPFLIEAIDKIKHNIPDFHLIIIGSGPEVGLLKDLIKDKKWIHYLGPKFGKEKIVLFKLSKVFLMPGLVGLAVLDAFASETPLVTTSFPFHSPEIEYLQNGKNGLISHDDIESYSENVCKILNDDAYLNLLKKGCKESAKIFTIESMVNNYKEGIAKCLHS